MRLIWSENRLGVIFLRDRPIFCTDLQIRTTFRLGWVGGFDEIGCSDFKGNEKSVHPEISYCFSISSHRSFILSFFPSFFKCVFPIGKLSGRNKFYE